jgi:carbonic anhydrase
VVVDEVDENGIPLTWKTVSLQEKVIEYLPGVTLPVVNIVNVEALTAEENAALTACKGAPCMLKVDTEAEYIALTLDYMARSNEYYFINGSGFGFKSTDGTTWTVMANASNAVVTEAQISEAMEASY